MAFFLKKIALVICTFVAFSASAQEFKPFKVNVSLGYAKPASGGSSDSFLFSLEPKYSLNRQFDLGVRLEQAVLVQNLNVVGTGKQANGTFNQKVLFSSLLKGTYFLSANRFRPYVGGGAGLYHVLASNQTITNGTIDQNTNATDEGNKFGLWCGVGSNTATSTLAQLTTRWAEQWIYCWANKP